jgi:hypothetical protein
MPTISLSEVAGVNARTKGKEAWFGVSQGHSRMVSNPYSTGSFYAYCWNAGYNQDIRNVRELHSDWKKTS